jgi:hypothetical protein
MYVLVSVRETLHRMPNEVPKLVSRAGEANFRCHIGRQSNAIHEYSFEYKYV